MEYAHSEHFASAARANLSTGQQAGEFRCDEGWRSALDERVRDQHAEARLRLRETLVLAVVAVALGVREDDDAIGREGGQGVLEGDGRIALAGVAGGVDALLQEALDGLLLRGLGLGDRLVGVRDPERQLGLVSG